MVSSPDIATDANGLQGLPAQMWADIRRRGLGCGERYLTAQQAGERFGVSRATADRAMKVLVARGILVRTRGRGTFVAKALTRTEATLPVVLVLVPEFRGRLSSPQRTSLPGLLHGHFPGAIVQSTVVPEEGALAHIRQVLASVQRQGRLERVFAISCRRDVYQYLIDEAVPTVVVGSLFPDQAALPSIEVDRAEAARLLTEHLVDRGHRRFLFLPAVSDRAGVHRFHDRVCDVLAAHGLPANALKVRISDGDLQALEAQAEALFAATNHPTAILADSAPLAEAVIEAANAAGLSVPGDVDVAYVGPLDEASSLLPCPHTRCAISLNDAVGQVLEAAAQAASGDSVTIRVPVELVAPSDGGMCSK